MIAAFKELSAANAHLFPCKPLSNPITSQLFALICDQQTPCIHVEKIPEETRLEFGERLNSLSSSGQHAENVESDLWVKCQHI
jgi:hypothetical protein